MHVKKGDEVLVITGKEKGKKGKITLSMPAKNRVVIEGLNKIKRHVRPRAMGQMGGIVEQEAPLHVSNVMLICPKCGRASRTGHRFLEATDSQGRAKKARFCKSCDAVIDE
ncbi:MAG: 50S ribosomal protein L24 [Chloroflexia bacterium]|nr:50S ribosomal protein L24 [Chloroflexia bacterium]